MEDMFKGLGDRIKQQRKLAGLTQEKLAEMAGISLSFLGHIEHGTRKASIDTLVKLCNALKISPNILLQDSLNDDLLGIEGNLSPSMRGLLREVTNTIVSYHGKE